MFGKKICQERAGFGRKEEGHKWSSPFLSFPFLSFPTQPNQPSPLKLVPLLGQERGEKLFIRKEKFWGKPLKLIEVFSSLSMSRKSNLFFFPSSGP